MIQGKNGSEAVIVGDLHLVEVVQVGGKAVERTVVANMELVTAIATRDLVLALEKVEVETEDIGAIHFDDSS